MAAFHGESRTVEVGFCEGWQVIGRWCILKAESAYPAGVDGKNRWELGNMYGGGDC